MVRMIAAVAAAWLLCAATATAAPPCYDLGHAGACPALACPTHRYSCLAVRVAVQSHGEDAVAARARACGWSEVEIAEARKCLR